MPWGDRRPARPLVTGALLTVVLLQVVRVWLPSLVLGPTQEAAATGLGLTAVAGTCVVLPLVGARLLTSPRAGRVLAVAAGALVTARLVLQASPGGWSQLVVATVGVVAGLLALAAWATRVEGHTGRLAVLFGVMLESVLHIAHGTFDLVWREGPVAVAGVLLLAAATLVVTLRAAGEAAAGPDVDDSWRGAAWPWLALGPTVALVLMVSAVPGRAAVATAWSPVLIAGVLAAGHAAAAAAALAGPRLGAVRCGPLGAGLVLLGTAGALRPVGALAVVAQVALALGAGLAVGALARVPGRSRPEGTALAATGLWVLAGLVLLGVHVWGRLPTTVDRRYVLVLAAALLAALALGGARRAAPPVGGPPHRGHVVTATGAITGVALLVATLSPLALPAPASPPPADDEELTLALLNLRSGFDGRTRFVPLAQADALRALAADVVVVNEIDRGWALTGGHDTLRLVSDRLGLEPRFAPASDDLRGDAMFTHLPVIESHRARLPRGASSADEALLSAVVEVGDGQRVAVLATRLHAGPARPEVRRRQARAVAAEVARLRGQGLEVVLLGDLQAEPQAPELEPLEDLLAHALPPGHRTWPAGRPLLQLDHVLVSDGFEVLAAEVVEVEVSGHLPVTVRLRAPEPEATGDDTG